MPTPYPLSEPTSKGSHASSVVFGVSADVPSPGDYDGDGKTDFAIFRPSSGTVAPSPCAMSM